MILSVIPIRGNLHLSICDYPINLRGNTCRFSVGMHCRELVSSMLPSSGAGYFAVPFHDSVRHTDSWALQGFLARNTVRTAFNARIINIKRCNSKSQSLSARFYKDGIIGAPSLFSRRKRPAGMNFACALLKRNNVSGHVKQSRLLNDYE